MGLGLSIISDNKSNENEMDTFRRNLSQVSDLVNKESRIIENNETIKKNIS